MPKDIKLSKNFMLSELIKSEIASRNKIDNWPQSQIIINNLKKLAENILQPIRDKFKIPFIPNCAYRCEEVEKILCKSDYQTKLKSGKVKSWKEYIAKKQHPNGHAADFEIAGISNYDLALWISKNLSFDQLILEFFDAKEGQSSGWVHCSYVSKEKNRKQLLTINSRFGTKTGLIK